MSLFQKTDETATPLTFSGKESVVALLFLTVTADGSIAPEEEELVIAASNRMKLLKDQGIHEFNNIVIKVRDAIDAQGRPAVFTAAAKGLPAGLQATVYALAADIIYASGSANSEETTFLREIQEALQIPDDFASKTLEVMQVKNQG